MFHNILVVFENEKICSNAVMYAQELAIRMDAEVTLLMLIEMTFFDNSFIASKRDAVMHIEERIGEKLRDLFALFMKHGVSVRATLKVGNPLEELVKFLAEKQPFQIIIWGSSENLPVKDHTAQKHWVQKVINILECPLFTVNGTVHKQAKNNYS